MHPQLTDEEREHQRLLKISQRRLTLQQQIQEQKAVNAELQSLRNYLPAEGERRYVAGVPPLDTDRIACIGISVGAVRERNVWVGGFGVTWVNNVHPPQASSYVCMFGGNFYPELLAVCAAIAATPPNESLAIITQSVQLIAFINNAKHKGKRKALTEQVEQEVRAMISSRSAPVVAVESRGQWARVIQKYASKLGTSARKLREDENPNLSNEKQAVLDATTVQPAHIQAPSYAPSQPKSSLPSSAQGSNAHASAFLQYATREPPTGSKYGLEIPREPPTGSKYGLEIPREPPTRRKYDLEIPREPPTRRKYDLEIPQEPPTRSKYDLEIPREPAALRHPSRPQPIPAYIPSHRPSRSLPTYEDPLSRGFAGTSKPTHPENTQPKVTQSHQQGLSGYPSAPRHASPPPSMRTSSRTGSSQPPVPFSQGDMHLAVSSGRAIASGLLGHPQTQVASGSGTSNVRTETPWIGRDTDVEQPGSVMHADSPAKVMIEDITQRFKESTKKRKRSEEPEEQGESDVLKKFRSVAISDDEDEQFYDAEEGQKSSWSDWFGGVVRKLL